MRQVLRPGALGRARGIGSRGRWEGGSGWGIHVNPWLIHVNVRQKPLQYCKVISLQLINEKKKKRRRIQTCIYGDFPGCPVVKNLPCHAGDVGLIPGWVIKIPHASEQLSPQATITEPEHS